MRIGAVILAGGRGRRMAAKVPKQYLLLCGRPVLSYSMQTFQESAVDEIVLVCGKGEIDFCKKMADERGITKLRTVVEGGKERYHSVYEGLSALSGVDLALVHDGARPFVTAELIDRVLAGITPESGCIPGIPVADTIKEVDAEGFSVRTLDRSCLYAVQTPQGFPYQKLCKAYAMLLDRERRGEAVSVTDDAMVAEQMLGLRVRIVPGSEKNRKVTTPEDLEIAEGILGGIGNGGGN